MNQFAVEIKSGPGRWDGWTECRVFETRAEADRYVAGIDPGHGIRIRPRSTVPL